MLFGAAIYTYNEPHRVLLAVFKDLECNDRKNLQTKQNGDAVGT